MQYSFKFTTFSECLKDNVVVDETIVLNELCLADSALFGNENNSGSVLQLVLTNLNICDVWNREME